MESGLARNSCMVYILVIGQSFDGHLQNVLTSARGRTPVEAEEVLPH